MNYYELLGLDGDLKAIETHSADELKAAFKKMALLHHPDKQAAAAATATATRTATSNQRFIDTKRAYDTLIDPLKRKAYNDLLKSI